MLVPERMLSRPKRFSPALIAKTFTNPTFAESMPHPAAVKAWAPSRSREIPLENG